MHDSTHSGLGANSGTVEAAGAGSYYATVTVTYQGCSDTVVTDPVQVYLPVEASLDLTSSCGLSYGFDYTCASNTTTLNGRSVSDGSDSGTATASAPATYDCTVTVTDNSRPDDLICYDEASDTVDVFAPLTASANLTATCTLAGGFSYSGSTSGGPAWGDLTYPKTADLAFSGLDGGTPNPTTDSSTSAVPSGSASVSDAGRYQGVLTVSYPYADASDAVDDYCTITASDTVKIQPISVTVDIGPSCDLSVDVDVTINGGDGNIESCELVVKDPSNTTIASFTTEPGSCGDQTGIAYSVAGDHTALFSVVDIQTFEDEPALNCPANNSDVEELAVPLSVYLQLTTAVPRCTIPGAPGVNQGTIDGVSYTAWPSGGSLNPSYRFKWDDGLGGAVFRGVTCPTSYGTDDTCGVDFNDSDFCALSNLQVTIDAKGPGATPSELLCSPDTSELETVTRETIMTASDTP